MNSAEPPAHADIRYLIAADVPRLAALADDEGIPDDEFCERCLSLRGHPLEEAPARRLARERARSWEFLSDKPQVPATAQEFFAFYEMANRLEPHYCTTIPARFRVEDDPLPFSHGSNIFDRVPVGSEHETSPAAEIPAATEELLRFVNRDDLPAECLAFAG